MAFRFFPPGVQFFTNDGKVLANGSLSFYDSGTTNPRPTYSDPEMTTPNPASVTLDGAGRPSVDIWGDGSYRVVLKDSLGTTIVTLDDVSGPQGIPDPSLQSGRFLTNDGTDLFWAPILQVPDPDGEAAGSVLTTDGSTYSWEPLPEPPAPPTVPTVEVGAASLEIGESTGGNRFLIQTGTVSAPASGGHTTSANVTFPTIFSAGVLFVSASVASYPVAAGGFGATVSCTSISNSGFTIRLDVNEAGSSGAFNIVNPVQLRWFACGLVAP